MRSKRVLITGAAGNLGRKLSHHLTELGGYDLVRLDLKPRGDDKVIKADFSIWDDVWVKQFQGVDTVVHLAADPNPFRSWQEMLAPNMDSVVHVYNAAIRGGVQRIIFASSNHALGGYHTEPFGEPLTAKTPPWPGMVADHDPTLTTTPYGAFKLVGERIGKTYVDIHGISFIGVRIGWVRHDDNSIPSVAGYDPWLSLMWLSDRDYCQLMHKCIEAPDSLRFAIINGMSNNERMRWDIDTARDLIGFVPEDGLTDADNEKYAKNN